MKCWVINQIRLRSNIETYQDTQVTQAHSVYRFIMVRLVTSLFIFEHVLLCFTAVLNFLFKRFASPKYTTEGLNMPSHVYVTDIGFSCWNNTYCKGLKAVQNASEMILHCLKSFCKNLTIENVP